MTWRASPIETSIRHAARREARFGQLLIGAAHADVNTSHTLVDRARQRCRACRAARGGIVSIGTLGAPLQGHTQNGRPGRPFSGARGGPESRREREGRPSHTSSLLRLRSDGPYSPCMPADAATTTPRSSARVFSIVARILFALAGLVTLAGGIFFTFFAAPEQGGVSTAADWGVAVWSLVMSIGYVAAAVLLRPERRGIFWFAVGLVVLHLVFGLVKLIGYQEYESMPFFLVDAAILVSLALSRRSR